MILFSIAILLIWDVKVRSTLGVIEERKVEFVRSWIDFWLMKPG